MYIHKDKERERGGESVYMYIHKDKERERGGESVYSIYSLNNEDIQIHSCSQ